MSWPLARAFRFASPEDMILAKLEWWQLGGGTSARQWNDVVEIMRRQQATLDLPYLRQSAPLLGVTTDLERALVDAGVQTP
ncbi:MAG TPA: hypothetical protein VGN32_11645 [Ktedonobacterales bacterium]|nr:hypothetical protein [Ktedonobacterales bacterium]